MATKPRIFSPTFALLSAATLCFFMSFAILLPLLPRYVKSLGASATQLGVVIGVFSVSAIVLRPFVGREVDRRGRKLFTALGIALSAIACLGYAVASGLGFLILVRLLHGMALACFYPGASTLAADLAPISRRAEALSLFSMFLYVGNAIGPAVGEYLAAREGFATTFVAASALGFVGLVLALLLREPDRTTSIAPRGPLINRDSLFPAGVLALAAPAWAALGFVPLYVEGQQGLGGIFFLTMSVTVLFLRSFVGKLADRFSRGAVIVPGVFVVALSMVIISTGPSRGAVIAGALAFGLGWGALWPGLLSLTIDRAEEGRRGSATGTFTAAFDLSFGLGSALLGTILDFAGFGVMFLTSAAGATAAGVLFLSRGGSEAPRQAEAANYLPR